MSRFSSLKEFGGNWEETSREPLDRDELKVIKKITVEERVSKGGNGSVKGERFRVLCFLQKSGKTRSEYLSKMSDLQDVKPGTEVDPKSVEFIYLERDGEEICKVDGEAI